MSRFIQHLPIIGDIATEVLINAWHIKVGDRVKKEQSLVDVETDKCVQEVPSVATGVVTAIYVNVGEKVSVNSPLLELEVDGNDGVLDASESTAGATALDANELTPNTVRQDTPMAVAFDARANSELLPEGSRPPDEMRLASPNVRRRAADLGIMLHNVPGTGPDGRVTSDDLDSYVKFNPPSKLELRTGVEKIPIEGVRRKIAEKMVQAKRRVPHFTYIEECDVTDLEALRSEFKARRMGYQPALTMLPFLIRAIVRTVPEFPKINARYDDESGFLITSQGIHIGIATQTERGLLVPVVHHAESLSIWDCARELIRLTEDARAGRSRAEDCVGSTITITSLGRLAGIASTPIVNYPEVAIIAPNKVVERPVVQDGEIIVRKLMNLSSSFDHRIVDGYEAAQFIQRLKQHLEQPASLVE